MTLKSKSQASQRPSARMSARTVKKTALNHQGTVLVGHVVCRGVAKGKVKIIAYKTHISSRHFKEGDILVAPFLSPDYAKIVHRAKGVIADVGSITSHTATILRELKIPCIVGVKGATTLLRDGDIVEIDAIDGTVKIV